MLGRTSNEKENILQQIREMLSVEVDEDGICFDAATLQAEQIKEEADYQGVRVLFKGNLDTAKIHMQIDIGFGDVVYPLPEKSVMPTILNLPAPELLVYSKETVIAEKFEAMVKLGSINSRMKDFYDIWMLSRQFEFEGERLAEAIRLTFANRNTSLPVEIEAFSDEFINSKQIQWTAFARRLNQEHVPAQFQEIIKGVRTFLFPLISALFTQIPVPKKWNGVNQWATSIT